jgi:hypothetical protein
LRPALCPASLGRGERHRWEPLVPGYPMWVYRCRGCGREYVGRAPKRLRYNQELKCWVRKWQRRGARGMLAGGLA